MQPHDTRPIGARVTMDMVGSSTPPRPISWTQKDTLLYALGVGASMDSAFTDLHYTTENSEGVTLKAVPSLLTVLALNLRPAQLDHLETSRFLHAEQRIELLRPIPSLGEGSLSSVVQSVQDKGTGAFITTMTALHGNDGNMIARSYNSLFVRGGGGFGGPRGETRPRPFPECAPDRRVAYATRPDQALLYRLSGDRNPLHSDPVHARARGFDRPILHGLCSYGFACRALIEGAAVGDPDRLRMMEVRLTKPVYPGETLTTEIWIMGDGELLFRTLDERGDTVLDRGAATISG